MDGNCLMSVVYLLSTAKSFGEGSKYDVVVPLTDRFVNGSIKRLFLMSINKPYLLRKSAPIIALDSFAKMNVKGNSRRRPRLTLISFFPYVVMGEPFAAVSIISDERLYCFNLLMGRIEISAPLSIKKLIWFSLS